MTFVDDKVYMTWVEFNNEFSSRNLAQRTISNLDPLVKSNWIYTKTIKDEAHGILDEKNYEICIGDPPSQTIIDKDVRSSGRVVQGIYEHFKGGLYYVLGEGVDEATRAQVVIYRPLHLKHDDQTGESFEITVRTKASFTSKVAGSDRLRFKLVHVFPETL